MDPDARATEIVNEWANGPFRRLPVTLSVTKLVIAVAEALKEAGGAPASPDQVEWETRVVDQMEKWPVRARRGKEEMAQAGPGGEKPGMWWSGRVKALEDVLRLLEGPGDAVEASEDPLLFDPAAKGRMEREVLAGAEAARESAGEPVRA